MTARLLIFFQKFPYAEFIFLHMFLLIENGDEEDEVATDAGSSDGCRFQPRIPVPAKMKKIKRIRINAGNNVKGSHDCLFLYFVMEK